MQFFKAEISLSCTCPYCSSDDVLGSIAEHVTLGATGVLALAMTSADFPEDVEFEHEEDIFRGLCRSCKRTFSVHIMSSAGDAYTLRTLDNGFRVAAGFSDSGRPTVLRIGDIDYRVDSVWNHKPLGGHLLSENRDDDAEDGLSHFRIYPGKFGSLFGRPPYGSWEISLAAPAAIDTPVPLLGPRCEIDVSPLYGVGELSGDLINVTLQRGDEATRKLVGTASPLAGYQILPSTFASVAMLTTCAALERLVCRLVWSYLQKHSGKRGTQWWATTLDAALVVSIRQRAQLPGRKSRAVIKDPEQYLTLGEARSLLDRHWQSVFSAHFAGKERILNLISELAEARNSAAHGRRVGFKDYAHAEEIALRIRKFFGL